VFDRNPPLRRLGGSLLVVRLVLFLGFDLDYRHGIGGTLVEAARPPGRRGEGR
jgi:hypothetical protein